MAHRYSVRQGLAHLEAIARQTAAQRAAFLQDVHLAVGATLDSKGRVIDSLKEVLDLLSKKANGKT